jgi:predicted ribosomally synthesized peptide with SipW-like signal peptide
MAVAAAGTVLAAGVGITSLAAWTDNEWVNGGFNGTAGVGTSKFEIEQNVGTGTTWTNDLPSGGGLVDFSALAQKLTPGDVVYGFVRLRAQVGSVAGTENLITDTATLTGLAQYLKYGAVVLDSTDGNTCNATTFARATATPLLVGLQPLTANGTQSFVMAAGTSTLPGAERVVCFQIAMNSTGVPDSAMGQTFDPIWHFNAQSN